MTERDRGQWRAGRRTDQRRWSRPTLKGRIAVIGVKPAVRRIRARLTPGVAVGLTACLVIPVGAALLQLADGSTPPQSTSSAAAPKPTARQNRANGQETDEEKWDGRVKILGDGSTSYTGPQPGQLKPERLKKGQKPPQFVVFSWDGALEGDDHTMSRFRKVAKVSNAHMTFFLTGLYLLPKDQSSLYLPPQHRAGSAAISYPTREHIRMTLDQLSRAWKDGHEIGSHFNGHFCGKKGEATGPRRSGPRRSTSSTPSFRTGRPTPATRTSIRFRSTPPVRSSVDGLRVLRARRLCSPR